ncbi:hypothetical protein PMALA_038280 [Plasmodium malariae]|uniref:Uncharacterized protein n=1 Tax=Plasmodium malariae TaxID=5858 RepID=A0A1A8WJC9_PLAMA|nr:hypothetical protein PMALA_038280 [Plasmodium malariae]
MFSCTLDKSLNNRSIVDSILDSRKERLLFENEKKPENIGIKVRFYDNENENLENEADNYESEKFDNVPSGNNGTGDTENEYYFGESEYDDKGEPTDKTNTKVSFMEFFNKCTTFLSTLFSAINNFFEKVIYWAASNIYKYMNSTDPSERKALIYAALQNSILTLALPLVFFVSAIPFIFVTFIFAQFLSVGATICFKLFCAISYIGGIIALLLPLIIGLLMVVYIPINYFKYLIGYGEKEDKTEL